LGKRHVMVYANLLQALTIGAYALLLYKHLVFLPFAIVFIYSFFNQFYVPAEASSLPLFLPKDLLPQANGIFFITQQSALVVGFGLGGLLTEILGFRATTILAAFLLFVAYMATFTLPNDRPKAKFNLKGEFEDKVNLFFTEILEGYRFIRDSKSILLPFLLLLWLQVILAVIVTNLPGIATNILSIKAGSSGIFIVMPAGIGAVVGTAILSRRYAKKRITNKLVLGAITFLGLDILLITIGLPLVDPTPLRVALGTVMFGAVGFLVVSILVPSVTYLQEKTPKEFLGRVFGNFWFLTTLATILPVLFSATISEILGVNVLMIFLALICFGVFVLIHKKNFSLS
jgi:MFS family permease